MRWSVGSTNPNPSPSPSPSPSPFTLVLTLTVILILTLTLSLHPNPSPNPNPKANPNQVRWQHEGDLRARRRLLAALDDEFELAFCAGDGDSKPSASYHGKVVNT